MATIPFTLASSLGSSLGSSATGQIGQLLNKAKLHGARVTRKSDQEAIATKLGVSYECVRQIQSALYTNPQGLPWNPNAKAGESCTPQIAEEFGYTFKGNEFDYISNQPVSSEIRISGIYDPSLNADSADVVAAAGGAQSGAAKIPVPNTVKAAQTVGPQIAKTASAQQDNAGPLDFLQTPSATPTLGAGAKTQQASALGGSTSSPLFLILGLLIGVASLFLSLGQAAKK